MYARRSWNPWREFAQLRSEMDSLFRQRAVAGVPQFNVWANDDSAIVTAEVPGLDPEKLDINVTQDLLTISGKYEDESLSEGEAYHRRERTPRNFERSLQLPFAVDAATAEAVGKNGVLEIRLHRPEEEKPRKLTVKAG